MGGGRNNSRLISWGHPSMTPAVAAISLLGSRRFAPLGAKGRAGQSRAGQSRAGGKAREEGCGGFLSGLWTRMRVSRVRGVCMLPDETAVS